MIQVKSFYAHNDLRNYSYLIYDDQTANAWVIDPYEAGPLIEHIKKNHFKLQGILNTHHHFDHIRGNEPLREAFGSPVRTLKNSEVIELDRKNILETLDSPGHTMDHQVFVWKNEAKSVALFSGDTLFNAGVGNCKNGGNVNDLYATTQKLIRTLPGETLLYPGHDYIKKNLEFAESVEPENKKIRELLRDVAEQDVAQRVAMTLGQEMSYNPFFRLGSEEIQETQKLHNEKELFKQLRSLRDNW